MDPCIALYDLTYLIYYRNVSLDRIHHEIQAAFQNIFIIQMGASSEQSADSQT